MRISSATLVLLLAACSPQATATADEDNRVDCALAGAATFARVCVAEWGPRWNGGSNEVVVRHPDGSFRRLIAYDDGRGFVAADGADKAEVSTQDQATVVAIDNDRYRFPARLVPDAGE